MAKDTALLVATVKNEGPNILEWVAYHRLCGFDRIQIYQNDSSDTTVQTLRTLDRIGAIEFYSNRQIKSGHQMRSYRRAARSDAYRDSTWCMTLDGDEFLNIKTGNHTVHDLVAACPEDAAAILVNWRVFGSNSQRDLSGKLVTERFTQAEPANAIRETALTPFKTLFRTSTFQRPGIHMPRDLKQSDTLICNASGLREDEFQRKHWRALDPGGRQFAQVNHYMLRDLPSFLLKRLRDSANEPRREIGLAYWKEHDRNEEEDTSLAKRAFEIWAEMKRLDREAGGKLLRMRSRGQRQSRMQFEEILQDGDYSELKDAILAETPMREPFKLPRYKEPVFSSVRAKPEDSPLLLQKTANG